MCGTTRVQILGAQQARRRSSRGILQTKYILVSGGVISGVGKGVISSSIGMLLKAQVCYFGAFTRRAMTSKATDNCS